MNRTVLKTVLSSVKIFQSRNICLRAPLMTEGCPKGFQQAVEKHISLQGVTAGMDMAAESVDEVSRDGFLKYTPPRVWAQPQLHVNGVSEGDKWDIGWIQGCSNVVVQNTYGSTGCTKVVNTQEKSFGSWRWPDGVRRPAEDYEMVNNAEDSEHFPWASESMVVSVADAPELPDSISLPFLYQPVALIPWAAPQSNTPNLSIVTRFQRFNAWLAVRSALTEEYCILKALQWHSLVTMTVDPTAELGNRVEITTLEHKREVKVLDKNRPVPENIYRPPAALETNRLLWFSASDLDSPEVIEFPRCTEAKYW